MSTTTNEIDWSSHYKFIVERLFKQQNASLLQSNRQTYELSNVKTTKPCTKCGSNNKYARCEKCALYSFADSCTENDVKHYINQNLAELTLAIKVKALKASYNKAYTKKINALKGTRVEEGKTSSSKARKRQRTDDQDGDE